MPYVCRFVGQGPYGSAQSRFTMHRLINRSMLNPATRGLTVTNKIGEESSNAENTARGT